MNDMDDKLIQMADDLGIAVVDDSDNSAALTPQKLAAYRSAILADAAKDVQTVAYRAMKTGALFDAEHTEALYPNKEDREGERNQLSPLVYASTLAAAQALNAELVARVKELNVALNDVLGEVSKISDILLPDSFDADVVRSAAIAARSGT